jgi:hypothetical protein
MDYTKNPEDQWHLPAGPSLPKQYPTTVPAPRGCRSIPQHTSSMLKGLQHQRSTKQLISRYEAMTPKPLSIAKPYKRSSQGLNPPKTLSSPFQGKGKGHSPIRHSIRNFLSVFKRGRVVSTEKANSRPDQPVDADRNVSTNSPARLADLATVSSQEPLVLHSGSLLHLSRSSSPQPHAVPHILPVWTTCTAILTATNIRITWLTSRGNPSIQNISLLQCTDVRSLALCQINPDEKALLPANGESNVEDLKVFEILFEGQRSERFAASSVQERAKWVSILW